MVDLNIISNSSKLAGAIVYTSNGKKTSNINIIAWTVEAGIFMDFQEI